WRWVVGLVYLGMLLAAWRLGRPFGAIGGPLACALVGAWVLGFSYVLFLHSELWGAPFFLAGALAVRRGDDRGGAALMVTATVVRELFGLGLLLGLVFGRRRRPWLVGLGAVGVLFAVHALLAS